MKKLFVLLALIMTSCTLSNEEKAEKLIKETLKGYLYYPESYEPVSTRVDSMFIDATAIEPIMGICDEIKDLDLMSKIFKCQMSIAHAETNMDFALEGYFSREDYAQAKKQKEKAEAAKDKYIEKLLGQIAFLKENVVKYHKGEFNGWAVTHIFRSLNGEGSKTIPGEMIFFCDEAFTTCRGYEIDEFEDFAKILKVVDEATSDEDIIDYFRE